MNKKVKHRFWKGHLKICNILLDGPATYKELKEKSGFKDNTISSLPNVRHHRRKQDICRCLRAIKNYLGHRANGLFLAVKTASRPIKPQPYLIGDELMATFC